MKAYREKSHVGKKAVYGGIVTHHTFEHMEQGTLRYLDKFLAIVDGYYYALPPEQYKRMIHEMFRCEE